jgi:hypothetical protein
MNEKTEQAISITQVTYRERHLLSPIRPLVGHWVAYRDCTPTAIAPTRTALVAALEKRGLI